MVLDKLLPCGGTMNTRFSRLPLLPAPSLQQKESASLLTNPAEYTSGAWFGQVWITCPLLELKRGSTPLNWDWVGLSLGRSGSPNYKVCFKLKQRRNGSWVVKNNRCAFQVSQVEMRMGREFQVEATNWIKAWRQDSIGKSNFTTGLRKTEKVRLKGVVESRDWKDKVFMPSFRGSGEAPKNIITYYKYNTSSRELKISFLHFLRVWYVVVCFI